MSPTTVPFMAALTGLGMAAFGLTLLALLVACAVLEWRTRAPWRVAVHHWAALAVYTAADVAMIAAGVALYLFTRA